MVKTLLNLSPTGSASVSEATSRSETPVGTGSSVGNAGASKRGRKGRRKGPHLTGRSPKLQFKCVGYLKEDHGQVNKLFLTNTFSLPYDIVFYCKALIHANTYRVIQLKWDKL